MGEPSPDGLSPDVWELLRRPRRVEKSWESQERLCMGCERRRFPLRQDERGGSRGLPCLPLDLSRSRDGLRRVCRLDDLAQGWEPFKKLFLGRCQPSNPVLKGVRRGSHRGTRLSSPLPLLSYLSEGPHAPIL